MGHTPSKATGIVVVWSQTVLYGVYVSLFFETVYIIVRRKRTKTLQSKIFLWTSIAMFLIATAHLGINYYNLLLSYAYLPDNADPTASFFKPIGWLNMTRGGLQAAMTWLGDALVIYRCYLIWNRSLKIVMLPISIFIMSIVSYSICVHKVLHLQFDTQLTRWVSTLYATFLVQNALTTAFIAYRIYSQYNLSRAVSSSTSETPASSGKLSPMGILRIIIESAAIYTLNSLLLNITYAIDNNAQHVLEATGVPIIGIVFTLMMVRIALTQSKSLLPTVRREMEELNTVPPRFAPRMSDPATTGRNLSVVGSGLGDDRSIDLEALQAEQKAGDDVLFRRNVATTLGLSTPAQHSNESSINLDDKPEVKTVGLPLGSSWDCKRVCGDGTGTVCELD